MEKERLQYLMLRYKERSLTPGELSELRAFMQPSSGEEAVEIFSAWMQEASVGAPASDEDITSLIARVLAVDKPLSSTIRNQPSKPVYRLKTWQWVAACSAIIVTAGLFYLRQPSSPAPPVANRPDVVPGREGAVLTLNDGTRVKLDSMPNGTVAVQQGARVTVNNGVLVYNQEGIASEATAYNTITTPNGRQFNLVLPDGSRLWLNAASSVRYPVAFTGHTREVYVTGETYFEIAPEEKPFIVHLKSAGNITVLGTSFNVNAYDAVAKTTLLSGRVKVNGTGDNSIILRPGEQAQSSMDGVTVNRHADTAMITAWRYGYFNFDNADLKELLGQISRWYDVEIVMEGPIPNIQFEGRVSRSATLPELLNILKAYGINCKLNGRKLTVLPSPQQ